MISLEGRGHDEHVLPAEKGDHGVSFGPGQGGDRCDHEGGLYCVTHCMTPILSQKCERADVTPGLVSLCHGAEECQARTNHKPDWPRDSQSQLSV